MSRVVIAAALIACTSLAAGAQEALPLRVTPGLAELGRDSALGGGITEQGRMTIMLPADRLKIVIHSYGGPPQQNATPVSATGATDTEKAVVDIMRANGIPDAKVVAPVLGNVTANDEIVGTIANPTHDAVAGIEERIVKALPVAILPALRGVNLEGTLEADTCGPTIERARIGAFADARKRAEALAAAAGLHVGALISASESDQTFGCVDIGNAQFFGTNGQSVYDGKINVGVNVTATFAIRP